MVRPSQAQSSPSLVEMKLITILLALLFQCEAFNSSPPKPSFNRWKLPAIIYGADGDVITDENNDESGGESMGISSFSDDDSLRYLASLLDGDLLARVGCAFVPDAHANLHPRQIVSATAVEMSTTFLDLSLGVADGGQVFQILVHLEFPQHLENMEAVVEYVRGLDVQANERIVQKEQQDENSEANNRKQRILQSLQKMPTMKDGLPGWWTFPGLSDDDDGNMAQESDSLKQLLNEDDFQSDLQALYRRSSNQNVGKSMDSTRVLRVSVASVGPSGLFLRAYVEGKNQCNGPSYSMLDSAIPFESTVATSAVQLRNAVLDLVESGAEPLDEVVDQPLEASVQIESAGTAAASSAPETTDVSATVAEARQRALLLARLELEESIRKAEIGPSITLREHNDEPYVATPSAALQARQRSLLEASAALVKTERTQRALLAASIRLDLQARSEALAVKREAFHRSLLESRIQFEKKSRTGFVSQALSASELQNKYASIEDIGERAFSILKDLQLV